MSENEKKNVSKQKSLPLTAASRYKHLNQTRRHSWFGNALGLPSSNQLEKLSGMYEIKEDNENNSENSSSWWKMNQWTNESDENCKPEPRPRKLNNPAAIPVSNARNPIFFQKL